MIMNALGVFYALPPLNDWNEEKPILFVFNPFLGLLLDYTRKPDIIPDIGFAPITILSWWSPYYRAHPLNKCLHKWMQIFLINLFILKNGFYTAVVWLVVRIIEVFYDTKKPWLDDLKWHDKSHDESYIWRCAATLNFL